MLSSLPSCPRCCRLRLPELPGQRGRRREAVRDRRHHQLGRLQRELRLRTMPLPQRTSSRSAHHGLPPPAYLAQVVEGAGGSGGSWAANCASTGNSGSLFFCADSACKDGCVSQAFNANTCYVIASPKAPSSAKSFNAACTPPVLASPSPSPVAVANGASGAAALAAAAAVAAVAVAAVVGV